MSLASKKRNRHIRAWGAAGLVLILVALGCGPATNGPEVSGKVTYKGQPVTGGTIKLYVKDAPPVAGGVDASFPIAIKPDGSFAASNVPIGMMQVAIETDSVKASASPVIDPKTGMPPGMRAPPGYDPSQFKAPPSPAPGTTAAYVQIPAKYGQPRTSELTWDIKAGSNKRDFELTD